MKKRTIIIVFSIILALILISGFLKLTGLYVIPGGEVTGCYETDNGFDIYEKGTASYENRPYNYTDVCVRARKLKEYYCTPGLPRELESKKIGCSKGCIDGACVK